MTTVYPTTRQPHTTAATTPEARESADLRVSSELAVMHARWSWPVPLSDGEADQRADDLGALARMARKAAAVRNGR